MKKVILPLLLSLMISPAFTAVKNKKDKAYKTPPAPPAFPVKAITLSDQRSFRSFYYKAIMTTAGTAPPVPQVPEAMLTATAFYRTKYYHTPGDTWEKLDYARMEKVLDGLEKAMEDLSK